MHVLLILGSAKSPFCTGTDYSTGVVRLTSLLYYTSCKDKEQASTQHFLPGSWFVYADLSMTIATYPVPWWTKRADISICICVHWTDKTLWKANTKHALTNLCFRVNPKTNMAVLASEDGLKYFSLLCGRPLNMIYRILKKASNQFYLSYFGGFVQK